MNGELNVAAQDWTTTMVSTQDFTHGANLAGRLSAVGYDWQQAGENIATGYATPDDVVQGWMASPDHCQNILNPAYASVGTGVVAAPILSAASGPATWTQDFGVALGQTPPSSDTTPMNGCPYSI